jgi:hypothetical protein
LPKPKPVNAKEFVFWVEGEIVIVAAVYRYEESKPPRLITD